MYSFVYVCVYIYTHTDVLHVQMHWAPHLFPVGLSSPLQMFRAPCMSCGKQLGDAPTSRCGFCITITQIFHLWTSGSQKQLEILKWLEVLIDLVYQSSALRCPKPEEQEEEEPSDQGSRSSRSRSRSRSRSSRAGICTQGRCGVDSAENHRTEQGYAREVRHWHR